MIGINLKKPKINRNIILSLLLLVGIVFSVIQIVRAVPPNPGHGWNEVECDTNMCVNTGTGSVGIGTLSPDGLQANITVSETARSADNVRLGVSGGTPRIIFEDNTFTQWEIDNISGQFRIFNPGTVRMLIDSSGNVGIGTTLPNGRLDVKGAGNTSATYGFGVRNSDDVYSVAVRDDGNVGIGTTSPGAKLHISGGASRFDSFTNSTPANGDFWFDGTNFLVREGGESVNIFRLAYANIYRNSPLNLTAINTWTDVPLDVEGVKKNITHSNTTNPERVTVDLAGTYTISYKVVSLATAARTAVTRLFKNGTTEISGSLSQVGFTAANTLTHGATVNVTLAANDYITIQAGTNVNTANEIDRYDDANLPDPTEASLVTLVIERID